MKKFARPEHPSHSPRHEKLAKFPGAVTDAIGPRVGRLIAKVFRQGETR